MTTAVSTTLTSSSIAHPTSGFPHYSAADIVLNFLKEKVKDVVKSLRYAAYWSNHFIPNLPANVSNFGAMMGDLKNFISASEVPEKALNACRALSRFWEDMTKKISNHSSMAWEKVGESARKFIKESSILTGNLSDSLDFATRFIPINPTFIAHFQTFNFAAAVTGNGLNVIEQVHNIDHLPRIDTRRTALYLIYLARDVSYAAFGAFGLFFILSGTAVVSWALVACVTFGLLFSMGGYFYEKIFDPEGKGKNLNPAVLMENRLQR